MLNYDRSQLVACRLTESESSADKAFRSHNPIPQASSKRLVPAEGSSAAGESFGESGAGAGWAGEKEAEVEPAATVGTGSQGGGETEDSSQDGEATALVRAACSGACGVFCDLVLRETLAGFAFSYSAFRCRGL